jgi:hypothetical protein
MASLNDVWSDWDTQTSNIISSTENANNTNFSNLTNINTIDQNQKYHHNPQSDNIIGKLENENLLLKEYIMKGGSQNNISLNNRLLFLIGIGYFVMFLLDTLTHSSSSTSSSN